MIDINPNSIYQRKMRNHPYIMISEIKGDAKSQTIVEYALAMEREYNSKDNLDALRVQWDSLRNETKIPDDATPYTIYYLRNGETVGYINDPSLDELKYFYKRCNAVSFYSNNTTEFSSINENNSQQIDLPIINDSYIELKMRISSPTRKIFQFKKKPHSNIFYNSSSFKFESVKYIL